ncbi:glycosyltransferase [Blastococcus sp. URHD0036]|uniref:glycosyltransferase n=1 Tax=Blastococcus sp. URHD0036 TaxID=1380356 RepID=UPI0012DE316A|nr:glycosyltransferase [Blastococcus sp. URHD0036]
MRVLQVTPRFRPDLGGTETHVAEVTRRLAERGRVDVTVLTTDRTGALPREEMGDGGVRVLRRRAWPRGRDWHVAPGLVRVVADRRWDVVHLQGVHTAVAPLAMATALLRRTPLVVSPHTGGHDARSRTAVRGLQWRVLGPLLRRAAAVLPVGRFEERLFERSAAVPADRFTIVRNGGALPPAPTEETPVPGRVVSVGRLQRYKGHHRAVEAVAALRRHDDRAHLHVYGAGPCEQELRDLAARLGIADHVTVTEVPPGDRAAMASALGRASVMAALSDYEAHPVAVMEALALGVPVVGTEVAGIGDLVEDGWVTGVAPGADAEEVASALLRAAGSGRRSSGPLLPTWEEAALALEGVYAAAARAGELPAAPAPATWRTVDLVRADVDRYRYMLELDGVLRPDSRSRTVSGLQALLICQGLQATVVHRVGHALWRWTPRSAAGRAVRTGARVAHWIANRVVETATGISIADQATIGPGLHISHFGGIIVGQVELGANCNLSPGVVIGRSGRGGDFGRPVLGDRCWVGPGAVLTGQLEVGDDAVIGANAVVLRSVPARSAAYGAPARIHAGRAGFEMVVYRGLATDPARLASLAALSRDRDPRAVEVG